MQNNVLNFAIPNPVCHGLVPNGPLRMEVVGNVILLFCRYYFSRHHHCICYCYYVALVIVNFVGPTAENYFQNKSIRVQKNGI